jgi:hypothetical protein
LLVIKRHDREVGGGSTIPRDDAGRKLSATAGKKSATKPREWMLDGRNSVIYQFVARMTKGGNAMSTRLPLAALAAVSFALLTFFAPRAEAAACTGKSVTITFSN